MVRRQTILRSIIIAKLQTEKTIPTGIAVHENWGSTNLDKLEILKNTKTKKKTEILQDGQTVFSNLSEIPIVCLNNTTVVLIIKRKIQSRQSFSGLMVGSIT